MINGVTMEVEEEEVEEEEEKEEERGKKKKKKKKKKSEPVKVIEVIELLTSDEEEEEGGGKMDVETIPLLSSTPVKSTARLKDNTASSNPVTSSTSPPLTSSSLPTPPTLLPDPLPLIPLRTLCTIPLSPSSPVYGIVTGSFVNRETPTYEQVMRIWKEGKFNTLKGAVLATTNQEPRLTYTVDLGWGTAYVPVCSSGSPHSGINPNPPKGRVLNSINRVVKTTSKKDGKVRGDRNVTNSVTEGDRARVGIREGEQKVGTLFWTREVPLSLSLSLSDCPQ